MAKQNSTKDDWPFPCDANEIAFSSKRVVEQGWPILVVSRDHDGDWQLLHGEIEEDDEMSQISMACAYQADATLAGVSSLKPGSIAEREKVGGDWSIEELDVPDDHLLIRLAYFFTNAFTKLTGSSSRVD